MNVEELYNKIILKEYKCKAGNRYFDKYRKIFTVITPEEKVRQKTANLCERVLKVPEVYIHTEEHLSHYGITEKNGRMDVAITYYPDEQTEKILAVVECKEESIRIDAQQVITQAANYSYYTEARYFILTNGLEANAYYYNHANNKYKQLNSIPTYDEMLKDEYHLQANDKAFIRTKYKDYYNYKQFAKQDWYANIIGEDTEEEKIPIILNLFDCFFDESKKFINIPSKRFSVVKDLGIQYRNYGDASGGGFGSGYYRMALIKDKTEEKQFLIGFSLMSTKKTEDDPVYGTREGQSVLTVIKNDGNNDDMAVQINLNKCLVICNNSTELVHNALITRKGKTKKGLLSYISMYNADLVKGSHISFGTFDCSISLFIDSPDVRRVLSNLIEYAFYRDEYKNL